MPIKSKPFEPEKPNPYLPPGPAPLVMEKFNGMDTYTTRPGVDDEKCWWIDGFMCINERNLRTLYGPTLAVHFATPISFFGFANIGATPYAIVIHTDGSIDAVNTATLAVTTIAPSGTIQNPSRLSTGLSQYGSQYVLIITSQTNGYFIWDGTTFYSPGGVAPQITITNAGSGYTSAPTVAITGGGGSGATAVATVTNGLVTAVTITNSGTGYTGTPTIGFSGGGGTGAAATVGTMPVGISGTGIETYQGRVWIINGAVLTFSAPGSVINFGSNGGGSNTSNDSFLRVHYTALVQTNGFLYLIADSSISYISGVQTSGSPAVTVFTQLNSDPEVGTPWPSTVTTFGRSVVFANAFGAHINYGAAVTKISDPLNGVYNTVPNFGGLIPSSAKSIIFGIKVWMLLLPIIDPFTGQQVNKLMMWDGKKWGASGQGVNLTYIQHQEIDSILTAWGTDGSSLYTLFSQPSSTFMKVVQSKYWDKPIGYQATKTVGRLYGMAQYYNFEAGDLLLYIDSENGTSIPRTLTPPQEIPVVNASLTVIPVHNALNQKVAVISSAPSNIAVFEAQATGQQGKILGMTATTFAADMSIISLMFQPEIARVDG